jgi:hypothetical protein
MGVARFITCAAEVPMFQIAGEQWLWLLVMHVDWIMIFILSSRRKCVAAIRILFSISLSKYHYLFISCFLGSLQKRFGTWPVMAVTQTAFVVRFVYYSMLVEPWAVLPCEVGLIIYIQYIHFLSLISSF